MLNSTKFDGLHSQHFTGSFYQNLRILQAFPCRFAPVPVYHLHLVCRLRKSSPLFLGSGTQSGLFSAVKPQVRDPRLWSQTGLKGSGKFRPYPGKKDAKAHVGVAWPDFRAQGFLRP